MHNLTATFHKNSNWCHFLTFICPPVTRPDPENISSPFCDALIFSYLDEVGEVDTWMLVG